MSSLIPTIEQAYHYIEKLDLSYLAIKMQSARYPLPRWTEKDASIAIQLYKNFLKLQKKYWLKHSLVPTREIDECWHNHILYTKDYTQDCLAIYGNYLHHQPADESEPELIKLAAEFAKTKELYLAEFGKHLLVIQRS